MSILKSSDSLAYAVFFKVGDKCVIHVFGDDDHPLFAKGVQIKIRSEKVGTEYTVDPKDGNDFYKRLKARKWAKA